MDLKYFTVATISGDLINFLWLIKVTLCLGLKQYYHHLAQNITLSGRLLLWTNLDMTKSVFLACLSAWEVSKIIDWFFLEIFLTKKSFNLTDWRLIWLYIRPSLSLWYLFHLELGGCIALGIGRLPLQFRLGIWPDFWTKPHYQAPRHLAKLQRQKQSKVSPVMIALRLLIKKQVFKNPSSSFC